MTADPNPDRSLPPIAPDIVEQEFGDEIDNVVPTLGYQTVPMVGLGGSAGSLAALQEFFRLMPPDSGMVFVVVMHLSPEHESILADLLQRTTSMRVIQVRQTESVLPNCVYVIPPAKVLTSLDGQLQLTDLLSERGRRVAVDVFFRTLADTHGPHAAAIVLSGADGDGAIGTKRIKERGGLTIAQTPDESEHSGMPRAAIATGMVDWVLNVKEMPERLVRYFQIEKSLKVPPEEGPQPAGPVRSSNDENETALRDALMFLRTRTGRDFTYYKRATILRRISRRMQVNGVEDLPNYLVFLRTHPGEAGALLQDLLISVTNFFRDRDAFESLREYLPRLFENKTSNDVIRVWVTACATGEEAYSIAILLTEIARELDSPPAIQIFATDLDDDVIREARDGIYPEAIAADVSEERLRKFFIKEPFGYRVRREIRESVLFAVHDLLKDSPFSRLDLVTCRNLLIYLTREAQSRVFDVFHFALRTEGILFLGSSETIDDDSPQFGLLNKKHRIYSHREAPRPPVIIPVGPSIAVRSREESERIKSGPVIARRALDVNVAVEGLRAQPPVIQGFSWGELHYKLIERFSPPSVVVNADHEILHLSESAGQFLQFSGGEPTRNLLRLVHPVLRIELRAALYRAAQSQEPAEAVSIPYESDDKRFRVTIRVQPAGDLSSGALLVAFELLRAAPSDPVEIEPVTSERERAARQLERELERLKSHLRDTVEQYEASAEELKAGNEELQAMNEELRSATEELETSREELQSINEELTTVNQELKGKVDELGHANSDMQNLMASTEIGTIFLNRDLQITRYTPPAVKLFNLIPTDLGRPLSDLTRHLDYPNLQADAAGVLERLIPIEREVGNNAGRSFLARLLPYRTTDDRIAGVVLTFIDITERKQAEQSLRQTAAELQAMFDVTSVGMAQVEPVSQRILRVNGKLCELLDIPCEELTDRSLRDMIHPDDRAGFESLYERLLNNDVAELSEDLRLVRRGGAEIWVHANVNVLWNEAGEPLRVVLLILDITERKKAEAALRLSENRWRDLTNALDERVRERTQELHQSEARLRKEAETSNRRALQLRDLAAQLNMAEQRERRRLAGILHDHIQQMLVAARMRVELVKANLTGQDVPQHLDIIDSCILDTIAVARSLAVELVPPLLHDQGLAAALEWLATQFEEQHGLVVEVDADPDADPVDENGRDLLFQSTRELLLNVVKHAKTKFAWVRLALENHAIVLDVHDDGCGVDPLQNSGTSGSFGLFHVRERIESLGGSLTLESAPKNGTRVRMSIPH